MHAVDIIIKVREHQELTTEEIQFFVHGIADGSIPDYQISAWAMAVLLNGLTSRETTDLTLAMAYSGEILDLTPYVKLAVDKHSTGGVGDKVTLVVEPTVAACGLPVAKISGRGLGFSGGTLDKLESIPGYRTDLSQEEFLTQLKSIGIVLTGQTGSLAPADGKLYALRDVTGTVPSIPLVAASVMGKKIAAGAQAIVLDVKVGNGAFMTNMEDARELSKLMVEIGCLIGRRVTALLSDMNQPLGCAVGNALEVKEALEALHGNGPKDLVAHCLTVAAHMLLLGSKAASLEEGKRMAKEAIQSGRAFEMFRKLVIAQGGDVSYVDHPEKLALAVHIEEVLAEQGGYIAEFHARTVGEVSVEMGAGRAKKGDVIDYSVGLLIHKKVGDRVEAGDLLFTIHARDAVSAQDAKRKVLAGIKLSKEPVQPLPLFYGVIE
ncbi:MAG: thymidine phosphorylase [Anaerolinea sp.]|nr:thymidine phosphorylase [Anaerolinea sp.]